MAIEGRPACLSLWRTIVNLVLGIVLPITRFVLAAKYQDDCPIQPYVVRYLYVAGAFMAFRSLMSLVVQISLWYGCCDEAAARVPLGFDIFLGLFLFCWLIAGSVWVYPLANDYQSQDSTADDYCNRKLYRGSFWIITIQWILMAISMILSVIEGCNTNKYSWNAL